MKRIIADQHIVDPNTLYKLPIGGINHLQEAHQEAIDALIKNILGTGTLSGGYVISGCVRTIAGADHSITAGSIYFYMNFTGWNSVTAYVAKDCVSLGGYSYTALQAGTNNDPSTSPTFWAKIGKHQEGMVFLVDAQTLTALANLVICEIRTTYAAIDPTSFTDNTTKSVHAIFKIGFKDAVTGSGIVDFLDLKRQFIDSVFFTPVISAGTGTYTTIGASGRWSQKGKIVILNFIANISTGTAGNQEIFIDSPSGFPSINSGSTAVGYAVGDLNEFVRIDFTSKIRITRTSLAAFGALASGTQFQGTIIFFQQ